MSYAVEHASAYADILAAGSAVVFTQIRSDSYDAATDTATTYTLSVGGAAMRVKGDPQRYLALGLTESEALTLLFAPTTYGERPTLGATVVFGGAYYTARSVAPVAPDGSDIISRVICAGAGVVTVAESILNESDSVAIVGDTL